MVTTTLPIRHNIGAVSIQLISPASGDPLRGLRACTFISVSIQLISPASGDADVERKAMIRDVQVSIQLISPASGDCRRAIAMSDPKDVATKSFHSTYFPSEWGL